MVSDVNPKHLRWQKAFAAQQRAVWWCAGGKFAIWRSSMYFSALRKSLEALEEKRFYDVALFFLSVEGYKELSIVDGTGDGGRDVVCSRSDLRIQLSVRKDWQKKINEEAKTSKLAGKRYFIYVTNRHIREALKTEFFAKDYKEKGEVEVSICDLNRISTSLSRPGVIQKAYEMLGMVVGAKISATPKEIAISNVLLFSNEAKELRENVIESHVKAYIFGTKGVEESALVDQVTGALPGSDIRQHVEAAIRRLKGSGALTQSGNALTLQASQEELMQAAMEEYRQATVSDVMTLSAKYHLQQSEAEQIIRLTLEIVARDRTLEGGGLQEEELLDFIANKLPQRKHVEIFKDLASLTTPRVSQYGGTINHIFSTNTFDIYRTLGRNSNVVMVLDSSVAMPMIFDLAFGSAQSRYGIAASALCDLCKEHSIRMVVPRVYLNEMASHGLKALEYLETYDALAGEAKAALKGSGNAYISHYSYISDRKRDDGSVISLATFLGYFGLKANAKLSAVENHIETVLDSFGIDILAIKALDLEIRKQIADRREGDFPLLIDHDAMVCTLLKNETDAGYVLTTWDHILMDAVEGLSRVFADTPARVLDFLSMAAGSQYESEHSFSLLTSLTYCDEKKAQALATKIEQIHSAEQAFEFKQYIDQVRDRNGPHWVLTETAADDFLSSRAHK
jgi:hypothetical protein